MKMKMKMKRITTRPPSPGNLPSFIFTILRNPSRGFHSDAVNANPTCTHRIKQTHSVSEIMIQTRCKSGRIRKDEALGYFNSMIQTKPLPSIWTLNYLLGALSKMKEYSAVVSMCKQLMGCAQFRPDVSTINIFLNCLCRLNQVDLGFSVLAITLKYGLKPDARSLTILLHGLCMYNSLAEAMELFKLIEEKGYECNEITYATMINGLCKAGKTSKALGILMKMWEDERLKPNQDCYNPIIDSLCKERRIEEALTLFRDMISKNVVPNVFSYTTLIHGLCNTSRWEEVLSLFGGMVDQGVKPNVVTYNTLSDLTINRTAIKELPPSIENLTGLKRLWFYGCENLANLPQSIYALPCLEYIGLSGCPKLVTLPPELSTNSNTSLDNFGSVALPNLERVFFDECSLSDIDTLANFGCLSKLQRISLRNSNFESLPACISKFVRLEELDLSGCKRLREILKLPPKIRRINIRDCILLEIFPTLSEMIRVDGDTRLIRWMNMSNCQRLCENLALDVSKMASVLLYQAGKCYEVPSITLSGSEVPNWFSCRKDVRVVVDGSTTDPVCLCEIFIEIPRTFKWKNTGLVFCAAFTSTQKYPYEYCEFTIRTAVNGVLIYEGGDLLQLRSKETDAARVWLTYIPLPAHIKSKVDEGGDQSKPYLCRVRVHCGSSDALLLKGCGVHLGNFSMPEDGGEDDDDVEDEDDDDVGGDDDDGEDVDDVATFSNL